MQLVEQVFCDASKDIESILCYTRMVRIALLIYTVEVEKVAEKSNLFITTFYIQQLCILPIYASIPVV